MKNKKAQIGTLQGIIIALIVIGIMIGIGFILLQEFTESIGTDSNSINNESFTLATAGTFVAANYTSRECYSGFSVAILENASDGGVIASLGNYSVGAGGRVYGLTDSAFIGRSVNISYSYLYDASNSSACEGLESTEDAIQEIPTWLTIVVIMFIVGILLAIVFRVLPSGGGSGSFNIGGRSEGGVIAEI